MATLIARLRRPLAFVPLLLLLGVIGLKVASGLTSDDEDGTKGVDQAASGEEYVDFGSAPPVSAPGSPGAGPAQPGVPAPTAGPGLTGRAPQLGGSGSQVSSPVGQPSLGGSGSGGSGSGSSGGPSSGPSFSPTQAPSSSPTSSPSPTPTPTTGPSPTPTPTGPPPVDPDYNNNGKVDLGEAQRYCREEKDLVFGDTGWAKCVNDTATI